MNIRNIILFLSLLLNIVLIVFLLKTYHYINQMQKKQDSSEKEILHILNRERAGVNFENMFEQCIGKIVVVFSEGMCISCSDRILQQITDLKEAQKQKLVVIIPESLQQEFKIYNESVYHLNNVNYSSDFLNFVTSEPILFYVSDTGKIIMPISLNYYPEGIERFFNCIFNN